MNTGELRARYDAQTCPDWDYYLHLTEDLRLGTFGHPWEQTLCVFGALLGFVEAELTGLLGAPPRRRDGS